MTPTFDASYYQRLASYREISESETVVFHTRLANLGYSYSGNDLYIICDACHAKAKILADWLRTKNGLRHISGCVFENVSNDRGTEAEGAQSNLFGGVEAASIKDGSFEEKFKLHDGSSFSGSTFSTSSELTYVPSDLLPSQQPVDDLNLNDSLSLPSSLQSLNNIETSSTGCEIPSNPCSYIDVDRLSFFDFQDLFYSECLSFSSSKELHKFTALGRECEKNPGHFAYFNMNSLKLEQIPSKFRCSEMLKLLNLMGNLTVRIVVTAISKKRIKGLTVENKHKRRVGTGFAIEHKCQSKISEKSTQPSIKRVMSLWKPKNINYVYIQTSRHVVFDDEEAQNTIVDFFYDGPDRKNVISIEGKFVLGSEVPGDNQCLLVCECTDSGFIQRLNELQQEFYQLAERLPLRVKKGLLKKLFMVHHPHGGPKVLSYGDFVRVKYKYCAGSDISQPVLTKLTNQEPVSPEVGLYRKALYYAADTCPGSCGAPILTNSLQTSSTQSNVSLQPDLWMHNGVETVHKLGASVLKACTIDDLVQRPDGPMDGHLTMPEDDSDDEASLGKQKVNSPVYKVISSLSHPEYILHQTRLDSFQKWTHSHILQAESLASSGFYYTGEADCIRCFHCGLGLRSFKQGDDVIAEHQKHRPSCPYLKVLLKGTQEISAGAEADTDSSSQSGENLMVKLLETENRERRRQLTCKICFKSEVRDVFLPC